MSQRIVQFRPRMDAYFGVCPVCRRGGELMVNFGREHWVVCRRDRVRWCFGENLFSSWRNQSEADYRANLARYGSFRVVAA